MSRERYLENLQDEVDGAYLYRTMAELEENHSLAELYVQLAEVEERHARFWQEKLAGDTEVEPSRRARLVAWMGRRISPALVLSVVASDEEKAQFMYDDQPETAGTSMRQDERSHARLLRSITAGGLEERGRNWGVSKVATARWEATPFERRYWGRTTGWSPTWR